MSQNYMKIFYVILATLSVFTLSEGLSVNDVFGRYFDDTRSDAKVKCERTSSGTGQCMFDLSCRLSYGQKVGDCGGFYQVCCVLPDKLPSYNRQQRLLEYSDIDESKTGIQDSRDQVPGQGGQCGMRMTAAKRVVGGTDAAFGSFPWMALVKGGQTRCGGALVGDRWVVTAAHCVRAHASVWSPGFTVVLGEHTLLQNSEPLPRQKYRVSKVHMHPLYQQTPEADRFDVAVLELSRPVSMRAHIQPLCLGAGEAGPGQVARVAGWGATHPTLLTRPKVLQTTEVVTLENKLCEQWHWNAGIKVDIHREMVCAGHEAGGRDACRGDSGGPLMTQDPDTGVWRLVGVVSAGFSCARPGQPGIYHRISESVSWIKYVMTN